MKNKLSDLNNHLFAELERLGDEELKGEALMQESGRAQAIAQVATRVVATGALVLRAKIAASETLGADMKIPLLLE
jgi:hypothetical protein